MIDTLRVRIDHIKGSDIEKVRTSLNDRLVVDNETGEIIKSFTTGSLLGSWDSRISVSIRDIDYVAAETIRKDQIDKIYCNDDKKRREIIKMITSSSGRKPPVMIHVPAYLEIEFSLAKWAYGVNFFNVPLIDDIRQMISFRLWLQRLFDIKLPDLYRWTVSRADFAVNYDMGSLDNITEYVALWRGLEYPRRKKPTFYQHSIYIPGTSTTIKGYAKSPEFKKHDYARLKAYLSAKAGIIDYDKKRLINRKMQSIMDSIDGIFRFEVEFHKRKLRSLGVFSVYQLFNQDWQKLMVDEMAKLIGNAPSGKVHTLKEVVKKIEIAHKNGYLKGKGVSKHSLVSVYTSLVTQGTAFTSEIYGRKMVYRAKVILRKLDISLLSTLVDHEKEIKVGKCDIKQFRQHNAFHNYRTVKRAMSWPKVANWS